jgi:molecular chaperone GrpE (heat shock protein)
MLRNFLGIRRCVSFKGADHLLEKASKLSESKNMLMLKYADAENLRKSRLSSVRRSEDDTNAKFASDFAEVAAEIHSLKTINSSLEISENLNSTKEGIVMTISAMNNGLEKHQLVQFVPDEGDPVDPSRVTDELGDRIVGETISAFVIPGWEYKGKIVIKAQVRVK